MFSEFRFAARGLMRWRGGAVTAALTLAIGIGVTTGLYAFVRVILPDLPGVPELDRVARIYASSQSLGVERSPVTVHEYDSTLAKAASFAAIGAYSDADATFGTGANVRPIIAGYASPGFFGALRVATATGRVFTAADVDATQPVAILSDALWKKEFAGSSLAGATVVIDGVERAVIGVMPPEFRYSFVGMNADVWIPMGKTWRTSPAIVTVYGRLRDGVGWPAAGDELAALSKGREPWKWRAIPIKEDTRYRALTGYAFTLGPAILVLLIACVNVACMLLARGVVRDQELSVRRALGATRWRVVRLLLAENIVLALVSGLLGGGISVVILRVIASALAAEHPEVTGQLAVDFSLLPVALAASATACLLFGTVPALRLSKRNDRGIVASLNGVPPEHRVQIAGYGARDVIVFTELASAVALIVWTAMLFTLFRQITRIHYALPADHLVVMRVPARRATEIRTNVAAVPGVTDVTLASGYLSAGMRVRATAAAGGTASLSRTGVSERFFDTLGMSIVRGRAFDAAELQGHRGVVVVSESAARQLAPDRDLLGSVVSLSGTNEKLVVIGIAQDAIDFGALSQAGSFAPADIYVPYTGAEGTESVVVARLATEPTGALRAIAAAAPTPAGARPVRPVILSEEAQQRGGSGTMIVVTVLFGFGVLTLLLAASGVFAVISQSVAQRTREFGIRMAIGATPGSVLRLVLVRETKLIGAAIGTGLVFTMALTRALFIELVRLSAILPSLWLGALALSGSVAAVAMAFATWKIVRLAPADVLRRT